MNRGRLIASVRRHEGYRAEPYRDTLNNWTIATGHLIHNLELSALECRTVGDLLDWLCDTARHEAWLDSDLRRAESDARRYLGDDAFNELSDVRQEVLVEMAFQLGGVGLSKFQKLRAAILAQRWIAAESEMLASRWAEQTPTRARTLAGLMAVG